MSKIEYKNSSRSFALNNKYVSCQELDILT